MIIHAFADPEGLGFSIYTAAKRRGWKSVLFTSIHNLDGERPGELAFVNMKHYPNRRNEDKKMIRRLVTHGFRPIPDERSSRMYDDKAAQAKELKKWLPRTMVLKTSGDAIKAIGALGYPFISKAAVGSGSHNVRLLNSPEEALVEINKAFGPGIKLRQGIQQNYVIWQEFLAGNAYDYRVLVIGEQSRLLLRRHNRPDRPMASGSGLPEPIVTLDRECEEVLDFANQIAREENFGWAGFDIVRCQRKGWRLLETTVSWTMTGGYYDCRFVGSGRMGFDIFEELLDAVSRGDFNRREK